MPSLRRPVVLALLVASLGAAGCGSGDQATDDANGSNGDNQVAESDTADVLEARRTIDAACGSDGSGTPDRATPVISSAVTTLVTITKLNPGRVYQTGNEDDAEKLSTVATKVAEQLRRCGITADAERLAKVGS